MLIYMHFTVSLILDAYFQMIACFSDAYFQMNDDYQALTVLAHQVFPFSNGLFLYCDFQLGNKLSIIVPQQSFTFIAPRCYSSWVLQQCWVSSLVPWFSESREIHAIQIGSHANWGHFSTFMKPCNLPRSCTHAT